MAPLSLSTPRIHYAVLNSKFFLNKASHKNLKFYRILYSKFLLLGLVIWLSK